MTRVKILTSCAGVKAAYTAGETVTVDDATARDLVQAGYAVKVSEPNEPAKVADNPAIPKKRKPPAKKTETKTYADPKRS